jgi:iron complex outermembrane receptor protein
MTDVCLDAVRSLLSLAPAVLLVAPPLARADSTTSSGDLEEVIVTAQKRAQNLQDVPMSITALSQATLEASGAADFFDYATRVPNLTFGYADGQGTTQSRSIAIRGIQGAGTTGFYLDDLPLPDGIDPLVLDLARIEVLRGPQGTLYGARSMGGTVRLITNDPDPSAFSGDVHGGLSYIQDQNPEAGYRADSSLNIPVAANAAMRVNVFSLVDPGWLEYRYPTPGTTDEFSISKNVAKVNEGGANMTFLWNVNDAFYVKPMVMYQNFDQYGLPLADYIPRDNIQNRPFYVPERAVDEWTIGALTMGWHTPVGDLTSATSYFHRNNFEVEDGTQWLASKSILDFTPPIPAPLLSEYPFHSITEELRFVAHKLGPLQITAGIFYNESWPNYRNPPWIVPGLAEVNGGAYGSNLAYTTYNNLSSRDRAIFTELTYTFLKHWSAIAGVRYSDNAQSFTRIANGILNGGPSTSSGSSSESKTTPKFTLAYQPRENLNLYTTAAEGFRPGGPNSTLPQVCAGDLAALGLTFAQTDTFKSDSVWSYEVGEKATLLDHRVTVNSALFYINWTDIQQIRFLPTCAFAFTGNAGAARSKGGEFEMNAAVTRELSVSLNVGYTDAKITESGPTIAAQVGDPVQQVAPWTISAAVQDSFPINASLQGSARLDYSFIDNSRSATNDQFDPRLRPAYEILNVRLGVSHGKWESSFYINNLTDTRPNLADNISDAGELQGRPRIVTAAPRTFGVEGKLRF